MHLERRQVVSLRTTSHAASPPGAYESGGVSSSIIIIGAAVAAVCAVALISALLTLTYRRKYSHSRTHSDSEKAHMRTGSTTLSDHGSPINLRATAAFQNIWQSVDLGRNSLPQNMIVKPGEGGGLAAILASMNPPVNASAVSNGNEGGKHAATDSSGSSTAVGSSSRTSPERRGSLRNSTELLDGYAAAQGGYDPDAQPLSAFSIHSNDESDDEDAEDNDDGCDLGEMAVVVVAGGEEVSQVLEGMQLDNFYVSGAERDEDGVLRMDALGGGYESAPSPLYNEFSAGDAW